MFHNVMPYLFWIVLGLAVIAASFRVWLKWPEMTRAVKKYRDDRKAERARIESLDAYFNNLRANQQAWFDSAYHKVPAPWRAQHRAAA